MSTGSHSDLRKLGAGVLLALAAYPWLHLAWVGFRFSSSLHGSRSTNLVCVWLCLSPVFALLATVLRARWRQDSDRRQ